MINASAVSIHDTCPLTGRDRRGHVVDRKALSESDICDRYVTPALDTAGWTTNRWRREYGFTDGKIIVRGKLVARG